MESKWKYCEADTANQTANQQTEFKEIKRKTQFLLIL